MTRLSGDLLARAQRTISLYPQKRSALIPLLHLVQEQDGHLTGDGMAHVAELLDLTPAEVYGTATFYDMLFTHPVGKYLVSICTNIACILRGADDLYHHCQDKLGIRHKQTTPDGQFSLEEVECIGACSWAPAVQVNYDFHENLTPEKMDGVLDEYRKRTRQ